MISMTKIEIGANLSLTVIISLIISSGICGKTAINVENNFLSVFVRINHLLESFMIYNYQYINIDNYQYQCTIIDEYKYINT